MKIFGERLKALRLEKGLTQSELAAELILSKQIISNYENATRSPDFETLVTIASTFGVTTDFLLGRSPYRTLDDAAKLSSVFEVTGLEEKAIKNLIPESLPQLVALSGFIGNDVFPALVSCLITYAVNDSKGFVSTLKSTDSHFLLDSIQEIGYDRFLLAKMSYFVEKIATDLRNQEGFEKLSEFMKTRGGN